MNEKPITQQEPDAVILPVALVNDILNYLNEKPHKEVANLIVAIQKNAQLIVTKPATKADPLAIKPDAKPKEADNEVLATEEDKA